MRQPMEVDFFHPSTRVELKYCEGCGGLQVRPVGSGLVFCMYCETRQLEDRVPLPAPLKRTRRRPRLPSGSAPELRGCADPHVYAVTMEVRA